MFLDLFSTSITVKCQIWIDWKENYSCIMGCRGGRGVVATETGPLLLKVLFSANE